MHNLLSCVHALCMNYETNTLLLVSSSVRSKQLIIGVFKKTTTATATGMSLNKRFKGTGKRGHIVADTNVSPFAPARNNCCGHKFCVRDTKNVSDFVQKHFVSATNVSQFAQHGNTTFILCPARLRAQETS